MLLGLVTRGAHRAPGAAAEALVARAHRFRTTGPRRVRTHRRITVLGDGLSYLITIGSRLGPRLACREQRNSNRNDDPRHVDCFLSECRLRPRTPAGTYANGGPQGRWASGRSRTAHL